MTWVYWDMEIGALNVCCRQYKSRLRSNVKYLLNFCLFNSAWYYGLVLERSHRQSIMQKRLVKPELIFLAPLFVCFFFQFLRSSSKASRLWSENTMSVNSSGRKCITICCPLLFWASSLSIEKDWYNYDNDILQILESDTDNEARFRSLVAVGTLVSVCRLWLVKLQAALIVLDWSLSGFWLLQSKRYLDLISPDKHLPMASKFTSLRMLFCQSVQHAKKSIKL